MTTLKPGSISEKRKQEDDVISNQDKTRVELGDLIHIYIMIVKVALLVKVNYLGIR